MKHIKMPKEMAEKWLAALRSGEYKQARHVMEERDWECNVIGYCCLGVLQEVVSGEIEIEGDEEIPAFAWCEANKVEFYNDDYVRGCIPYCDQVKGSFTSINDKGVCFNIIADLIETELEMVE